MRKRGPGASESKQDQSLLGSSATAGQGKDEEKWQSKARSALTSLPCGGPPRCQLAGLSGHFRAADGNCHRRALLPHCGPPLPAHRPG
ncbi:hypothetical protein AGIG_G20516 [Arapaima gigas]